MVSCYDTDSRNGQDVLLEHSHSVVTSVRTEEKGKSILKNHPNVPKDKLDFVVVEDIAKPDAFDEAIKSNPPFETVIHTASPFHYNVTDMKKDLLDPAINGTTGILKAIKKGAPSVKRVVSNLKRKLLREKIQFHR